MIFFHKKDKSTKGSSFYKRKIPRRPDYLAPNYVWIPGREDERVNNPDLMPYFKNSDLVETHENMYHEFGDSRKDVSEEYINIRLNALEVGCAALFNYMKIVLEKGLINEACPFTWHKESFEQRNGYATYDVSLSNECAIATTAYKMLSFLENDTITQTHPIERELDYSAIKELYGIKEAADGCFVDKNGFKYWNPIFLPEFVDGKDTYSGYYARNKRKQEGDYIPLYKTAKTRDREYIEDYYEEYVRPVLLKNNLDPMTMIYPLEFFKILKNEVNPSSTLGAVFTTFIRDDADGDPFHVMIPFKEYPKIKSNVAVYIPECARLLREQGDNYAMGYNYGYDEQFYSKNTRNFKSGDGYAQVFDHRQLKTDNQIPKVKEDFEFIGYDEVMAQSHEYRGGVEESKLRIIKASRIESKEFCPEENTYIAKIFGVPCKGRGIKYSDRFGHDPEGNLFNDPRADTYVHPKGNNGEVLHSVYYFGKSSQEYFKTLNEFEKAQKEHRFGPRRIVSWPVLIEFTPNTPDCVLERDIARAISFGFRGGQYICTKKDYEYNIVRVRENGFLATGGVFGNGEFFLYTYDSEPFEDNKPSLFRVPELFVEEVDAKYYRPEGGGTYQPTQEDIDNSYSNHCSKRLWNP